MWDCGRIIGFMDTSHSRSFYGILQKYFEESSQCYIEWCHFQRWEIISSCRFKTEFGLLGAWHFKRPSSQINYFVLDPGSKLEEFLNSYTNCEFQGINWTPIILIRWNYKIMYLLNLTNLWMIKSTNGIRMMLDLNLNLKNGWNGLSTCLLL